ncbi:MAG: Uma2 family endonuclease [Cyanobacteria bacterium J06560_2]
MTIAKNRSMTLEEYLTYDDGTDARYELIDGILVDMGAEADINIVIGSFLFSIFLQFAPHYCIRKGTEIAITGSSNANTRIPDLMVLTEEGAAALAGKSRSMIMLEMPGPALVIEVVSSSNTNRESRERDYTRKREEYAARGISEYWIVDPIEQVVWVLTLSDQNYIEEKFTGDNLLRSSYFPQLKLSANKVLTGGVSTDSSR